MSYFHENLTSSEEMSVSVRLWAEDQQLYSSLGAGSSTGGIVGGSVGGSVASRAEVMRTLAEVEMILILAQHTSGSVDPVISGVELETGVTTDTGLGPVSWVEQCLCPVGYTGLSCETCAPGYDRGQGGACVKDSPASCPPGYYGDPNSGTGGYSDCNCALQPNGKLFKTKRAFFLKSNGNRTM